jgi:hypothetical protein
MVVSRLPPPAANVGLQRGGTRTPPEVVARTP